MAAIQAEQGGLAFLGVAAYRPSLTVNSVVILYDAAVAGDAYSQNTAPGNGGAALGGGFALDLGGSQQGTYSVSSTIVVANLAIGGAGTAGLSGQVGQNGGSGGSAAGGGIGVTGNNDNQRTHSFAQFVAGRNVADGGAGGNAGAGNHGGIQAGGTGGAGGMASGGGIDLSNLLGGTVTYQGGLLASNVAAGGNSGDGGASSGFFLGNINGFVGLRGAGFGGGIYSTTGVKLLGVNIATNVALFGRAGLGTTNPTAQPSSYGGGAATNTPDPRRYLQRERKHRHLPRHLLGDDGDPLVRSSASPVDPPLVARPRGRERMAG